MFSKYRDAIFINDAHVIPVFVDDVMSDPPANAIIRSLKTVVAWTSAIDYLYTHPLPLPTHAHLVSVPHAPLPATLDDEIAKFKTRILDHSDLEETKAEATALLDTDFNLEPGAVKNASVHPEAIAIGLAQSFWSPAAAEKSSLDLSAEDRDVLRRVFEVRHTARTSVFSDVIVVLRY